MAENNSPNIHQLGFTMIRELGAISEIIRATRNELHRASLDSFQNEQLPNAHDELDEVIHSTEEATHKILEAAEIITEKLSVRGQYALVEEPVLSIFEACSFQDITSQRIRKVIHTIRFVEENILTLLHKVDKELQAIDDNFQPEKSSSDPKSKNEGPLLGRFFSKKSKIQQFKESIFGSNHEEILLFDHFSHDVSSPTPSLPLQNLNEVCPSSHDKKITLKKGIREEKPRPSALLTKDTSQKSLKNSAEQEGSAFEAFESFSPHNEKEETKNEEKKHTKSKDAFSQSHHSPPLPTQTSNLDKFQQKNTQSHLQKDLQKDLIKDEKDFNPKDDESHLLNGPAKKGKGLSQKNVDDLMNS
jgi:chemotaxis protein CheZ